MTITLSALDLPFEEAIAYLRGKTNVTSRDYTDVWGKANVKSFTVAGAATQALVGDFRREVAKALEQGTSLQEFRKSFDQIVAKHGWEHTGQPGWRSRVIYETNLSMAYSAGRWSQQTEPETLAAFPFLQYVHSGALHPRLQHVAWNGLTLRADDPFWKSHYPPNGWHCGCRARSVSARGLQRMGKSGPDRAPTIEMREVVIRRTGEVKWVAEGIDPGFDYNPGMEWAGTAPQIPATATLRTPQVRTPDDPAREVEDFARRVLDGDINDRAASIVAARVPAAVVEAIGAQGGSVELSAFRILKVAGRAEEMGGVASVPHPEVTARDWGQLQQILDAGQWWLERPTGPAGHRQAMVFAEVDGKQMMAVLRSVATPSGSGRIIVPTFQQVGRRRIVRLTKRLEEIKVGR